MVLVISCSSSKNNVDKLLFNTTWELEYLSESSMEVSELYTNKKPQITFHKTLNTLKGNSGCNGYSAEFSLDNEKVSIGEPGPATKMYCGEGEQLGIHHRMSQKNSIKYDGVFYFKLKLVCDYGVNTTFTHPSSLFLNFL